MRSKSSDVKPLTEFEEDALSKGFKLIAGVDEAGRGPLAGPVVAAAVILKPGEYPDGVRDSKELSAKRREEAFYRICEKAAAVGVGIVSEKVIDRINILRATQQAMRKAISALNVEPQLILIDGFTVPQVNRVPFGRQKAIVDGDAKSVSIAAASIIAKVTRDRMMVEQDRVYPQYGFGTHKGYGTKRHLDALAEYGPCRIHRFSFAPVIKAQQKRRRFSFPGAKTKMTEAVSQSG